MNSRRALIVLLLAAGCAADKYEQHRRKEEQELELRKAADRAAIKACKESAAPEACAAACRAIEDPSKVLEFCEISCDAKNEGSCTIGGNCASIVKDNRLASAFYEAGCRLGSPHSCSGVWDMTDAGEYTGTLTTEEYQKPVADSCGRKEQQGCLYLGRAKLREWRKTNAMDSLKFAMMFMRSACEAKSVDAYALDESCGITTCLTGTPKAMSPTHQELDCKTWHLPLNLMNVFQGN